MIAGPRALPVGLGVVPTATAVRTASTTAHAGSTFTASGGLGTATAASLTLTLPSSTTATAWTDMPRLVKNVAASIAGFQVSARLAATSGLDANTFLPLALRDASGSELVLVQTSGVGVVTVYDASGLVTNAGSLVAFNGTEGFRITLREGHLTAEYSADVSAGQWTPFYRAADRPTIPASPWTYTYLAMNLYQGSGAAGPVSAQWADVQTMAG